jgi:hypothetical protein
MNAPAMACPWPAVLAQSHKESQMSYAHSPRGETATMEQPMMSTLSDILETCHKSASCTQEVLDRVVGASLDPSKATLAPAPNGSLEDVLETVRRLRDRLDDIESRSRRIG